MPTPAEILQDPNFQTLSPADRHSVMLRVDPGGFGKLDGKIQGEVIGAPDFRLTTATAPERTWRDEALDFAKGAGSGLASTVFHGGDLIRRGLGMERVIDKPEVQASITAPDSTAGWLGNTLEQGLEFLIPGGGTGGALRRALTLGGKSAAVRTAQTGDPVEGLETGAVVGAVPGAIGLAKAASPTVKNAVGAGLGATAKFTKRSSLLRPLAHPTEAVEAVKGGVKDFRVRQAFDAATTENAARDTAEATRIQQRLATAAEGRATRKAGEPQLRPETRTVPNANPIPGQLPSGRQAGPAPVRPQVEVPPRPAPAWRSFPREARPTPNADPIPSSLPSGRVPGPASVTPRLPRPAPAWRKEAIAAAETPQATSVPAAPSQPPALPSGRVPGRPRFPEDGATHTATPAPAPAPTVPAAPAPASPAPTGTLSRFKIDIPEGQAEHYGETGQAFGNRMAVNSAAKDAAIIKHLASKGVTPETFAGATEQIRNAWLKEVNQATGAKYTAYRGQAGADSATRLLKTWKWATAPKPSNY